MPLSINLFREEKGGETSVLVSSQSARFAKPEVVENIKALDVAWRKAEFDVNQLNRQKNQISKEVGKKNQAKEDASELVGKVSVIKNEIKEKEKIMLDLENQIRLQLRLVGNIVHSSVPISKDEANNVVVKRWGTVDESKTGKGYHHHELLFMIDGYDSERGVAIAGHRAFFLKGVGVLLNQALINYGLAFLTKKQYTALQPPYFMKEEIMAETAQLEEFDEALYKVTGSAEDSEMYLIATSEQPISAYHRGEWITPEDLPLRYAGSSTCFRKEAGSHGKDAWGIFRIHQFEKIEQFVLTAPEQSWAMHEEMISTCEDFYQSLGLSYHIINIVSGALNNAAAKKYDLEAWFPKLGVYRELVSASNCTDYQSRAMETRYGHKKMGQTDKVYVHMLNATLCATERTICCILENFQTDKGVVVPEVLRPYMGGIDFLPFKFPAPKPTAAVTAEAVKQAEKDKAKAAAGATPIAAAAAAAATAVPEKK